jgi:hypothetical protein
MRLFNTSLHTTWLTAPKSRAHPYIQIINITLTIILHSNPNNTMNRKSLTNPQLVGKGWTIIIPASKGRKTSWKDGIPWNETNPDFFHRWKQSTFLMLALNTARSCIELSRLRHLYSNVQTTY